MASLVRLDHQCPTDYKGALVQYVEGIDYGLAIPVENDGVGKLEYGPFVLWRLGRDSTQDGRFLAPVHGGLGRCLVLEARRGASPPAPGHDVVSMWIMD